MMNLIIDSFVDDCVLHVCKPARVPHVRPHTRVVVRVGGLDWHAGFPLGTLSLG